MVPLGSTLQTCSVTGLRCCCDSDTTATRRSVGVRADASGVVAAEDGEAVLDPVLLAAEVHPDIGVPELLEALRGDL